MSIQVDSSERKDGTAEEKLLEELRDRFKTAEDAEREVRELALDDLRFCAGEQWPDEIKAQRQSDRRPCLVINRLPQHIQQVTNDQRQNRPSIRVKPVDDAGDIEVAKVIQGLIRHIEYSSNADVAYDTAFEQAVTGGFGYFRIITDYCDPLSFDQEIKFQRIRNQFSVLFDPHSQEPDGSDSNYAFIFEELTKDEYKLRYPDTLIGTGEEFELLGNKKSDWVGEKTVMVAEYFYKEFEEKTLVKVRDFEGNELIRLKEDIDLEMLPEGAEIVEERTVQVPSVKWCKTNGHEILEKQDWVGKFIPIIPVYGHERIINGEKRYEGIVRNSKDPQRMYNYWASAETEAIALAPRAPWLVGEGQVEGYEHEWDTANQRNHAYLTYKTKDSTNQPLPPPQRQTFEPAVQAITNARMLASEDMKATTGIYDASLGAQSNETSGIAIQRRNVQAQTSNFHFIDNLTRSLRHAGRIIVDLIPRIYDTERAVRIIGDDDEERIVKLNVAFQEKGKTETVLYKLDTGKYDVVVDTGPSFASKRQEAVEAMLEITRAYPQIAAVAGDLIVKNMDVPGAQDLAERLKKTLPPELRDEEQGDIPPEIQGKMQQMEQMIQGLTEELNKAQEEKERDLIKIESNERIKMRELETKVEIELAKLDQAASVETLRAEINELKERQSYLRTAEPVYQESPAPQQGLPPQPDGAPIDGGAGFGMDGGQMPTGGPAPGSDMEGI